MNVNTRRYVFLDFETLKRIKFKKLEKICDKIFIFIGRDTDNIPLTLVRDMQKMGNSIKWIDSSADTLVDLNFHICFLMGKLHEKINTDIEFAILSNDTAFDPLIHFINTTGRNCLRIRQSAPEMSPAEQDVNGEKPTSELPNLHTEDLNMRHIEDINVEFDKEAILKDDPNIVEETARETMERLMRSGNRPHNISMLRSYILLHNQELSQHGNVDKIINKLETSQSIEILNGDIEYHF